MSDPHGLRPLAERARFGALATIARDPEGWPFATLVAVAFDAAGRPLFCLSRLAEHTKNLENCERASLLVAESSPSGDPLATARMTLLGRCARVVEAERSGALATFLAAHPEAATYAGFADFAVWRLEVAGVRWVGGFGRMQWVAAADYARAWAAGGLGGA